MDSSYCSTADLPIASVLYCSPFAYPSFGCTRAAGLASLGAFFAKLSTVIEMLQQQQSNCSLGRSCLGTWLRKSATAIEVADSVGSSS